MVIVEPALSVSIRFVLGTRFSCVNNVCRDRIIRCSPQQSQSLPASSRTTRTPAYRSPNPSPLAAMGALPRVARSGRYGREAGKPRGVPPLSDPGASRYGFLSPTLASPCASDEGKITNSTKQITNSKYQLTCDNRLKREGVIPYHSSPVFYRL